MSGYTYVNAERENVTKEDLEKALSNLNKETNEEEKEKSSIVKNLVHTLKHVKIPVSVSFLNISFAGWGRKAAITPMFLKEHRDIFSLVVMGNDLKIKLRKDNDEFVENQTPGKFQLSQLIMKDIDKLKLLQNSFQRQEIKEVLYEDFIGKYSSKKYKINLSFCVRNSHALKIFSRDQQTYIRFLYDTEDNIDMNEDEVWNAVQKDVDAFIVLCLKGLLQNFFVPINQGTLQSCFNFGIAVIDKSFLRAHHEVFEGSGETGIALKGSMCINIGNMTGEKEQKSPLKLEDNSCSNNVIMTKLKSAIDEKKSVVLIGSDSKKPIILDTSKLDENNRLSILLMIRDAIDHEICNKKDD